MCVMTLLLLAVWYLLYLGTVQFSLHKMLSRKDERHYTIPWHGEKPCLVSMAEFKRKHRPSNLLKEKIRVTATICTMYIHLGVYSLHPPGKQGANEL
jgi:hypothetical protein